MPALQTKRRRGGPGGFLGKLSSNVFVLMGAGIVCLASLTILPILVLEGLADQQPMHSNHQISVQHAVHGAQNAAVPRQANNNNAGDTTSTTAKTRTTKDGRELLDISIADLDTTLDETIVPNLPVARGVAGAPLELTPGVQGAKRAHIDNCDINVDSLAYWNDPIGSRVFVSPFAVHDDDDEEKYISFAPDRGGWNNVRMSMEIIFVIAAATGRTLVLPPKEPMYLLHHDKGSIHRGFADFFPIHTAQFQKQVRVISFAEFLEREKDGTLAPPADVANIVQAAADHCDKRDNSESPCKPVFEYLKNVGHSPEISAVHTCLVFDENKYTGATVEPETQERLDTICGSKRQQLFWDQELNSHKLIHFRASEKEYRLLSHFYGMIHFTNPAIDHYYKRFVRDFLHYHDSIYCAAGKIVKAVQAEGVARGFQIDSEGAGAYSALHVRRGDLQYKKVKIPAQEWYDNTKEVWKPNEILYIATDEKDKSFFDDIAKHHDLRFLDDYWDFAGLSELDPNYMGMIDTIVASRGRAFAGTWFSTFSGYINRLRGHHGMSMMDSWYSFLDRKTAMHEWKTVDDFAYAFEWPDGWVGIDKDEFPSRDKF